MEVKIKGCVPKSLFARMYMREGVYSRPVEAFSRMLKESREVMEKLRAAGYVPTHKTLTPKQAQIVIDHFGLPDIDSPETKKYFSCSTTVTPSKS
ncbi:DUF4248 domain-containing protein [Marinilabilia salmonicolor]|uniref:Uncharacterized protein DUF4248 n=1 Tax=Marinilabilia salmonicolor TaxID=989 RepID=A0A368ULY5_9BACT|nr:DUF4248 domain-containing protein [Marinilabilia salmonicolor]RCW29683.1 uncharacterized protein DUF4248 [Marinilabilia salmonicolor]